MRLRFAVVVASFAVACHCNRPPGQTQDSGPDMQQCMGDGDCPLGYQCTQNVCLAPMSFDGSSGCVMDTDCPNGQRCLRSTGQCITPMDGGDVLPDAGPSGDCFEGQVTSCGVSKLGDCKLGTSTCTLVDGRWQLGPCVGEVDPKPETCDGTDENCDGQIDDGLGDLNCGVGECARTVPACSGGMPGMCTPGTGSAEVCDGLDNDCNGLTDEGLTATCGIGACMRTQPACANGMSVACVPGMPATEVCNGIDDNCDGNTDEGLGSTSCGTGACARVQVNCVMGVPKTCVPGPMMTEVCNGIDDNCNGTIDEGCACTPGVTQGCYSGPAGTADAGICHGGSQFCDAGTWGPCNGQVLPAMKETCNHLDDDCNGLTDEGLGTSSCGIGACARTVQSCVNGVVQSCDAGLPTTEACNNIDDDCNGITDDVVPAMQTCGTGACQRTTATCASGMSVMCMPGPMMTEICNGIDDNCNGSTDETFPESGMSCSTGLLGVCATGAFSCSSGTLVCTQTHFPSSEICNNGIDENCNGIVDDPITCGCNSTIDKDLDGYNQCVDCNDNNGAIHPGATEVCNGIDDNCNMLIDEGFDVDMDGFTTCGTKPGGGTDPLRIDCNDNNNFIFPLKVTDCGAAATPNTPNGVDDNCNGYIDETCGCSTQDKDMDGYSPCQGDCNDSNKNIHPDAGEICDGLDDDCNKATVDNCGVSQPCGSKVGNTWVQFPAGTDQCKPDLICVSSLATGALTCGSYCNQTVGLGLNDSCASTEGCYSPLIDSDNLSLCEVLPVGAGATGASCTVGSQCRSGWCGSGYCTDQCTHQAGCSANTTCTITLTSVKVGPTTYKSFESQCTLTSQISGMKTLGQTCTAGQCVTGPNGCFNGVCVAPCCSSGDCPGGDVCTINGPTTSITGGTQFSGVPVCLASSATRVSGQACTTSSQCKSGICDATTGICDDLCCNDTSCQNGTACRPIELHLADGGVYDVARLCLFPPYPAIVTQK
jgi:hypothetical protein